MHITETFTDLVELAFVLMKSKARNAKDVGYKCSLTKAQVESLAVDAFLEVLGRRQTRYGDVIGFLKERRKRSGVEVKMKGKARGGGLGDVSLF